MTSPPDFAVRALLTDLGLSHLIAVFAKHEVDDAAYLQLQDADLRDISISRGNRRKILTAIQTIKERDPAIVTECGICMDANVEVRVVGCGHTMCSACAAGWFARTPAGKITECPTCRGPCTDFEPLVPPAIELATTRPSPVPIVQSAVETPRHQIFVGRAYDMTTLQLIELFKEFGRVVDAFIMLDSAGRSKGCGIVAFSEPEAAARAIEIWHQKRHPRWSKLIVERARGRFADAAAERAVVAGTRAVVAGTRARAASVERTDLDVASEALLCYEAAEARAVAAEARVALTEARARTAEARAVTALTRARATEARVASTETRAVAAETQACAAEARVASAEARAVAAETQARAAEAARSRACATASAFRVENTGLLAKLDASEAAAAAAAARAAETEDSRERLVLSPGEDLPDPNHDIASPPYEPLPMPLAYVPGWSPPVVLGPVAPGSLPWSWGPPLRFAAPPPPETIFQGTVVDLGPKENATAKRRYGFIRVDHTHNLVFVSPQDAPDGYVSDGDRCKFRIVEYRNQKHRKAPVEGTRLRWKAVDVVCVQRAAPQPSC